MIGLITRLIEVPDQSFFVNDQDSIKFNLRSWRSLISLVPQEPFFFNASIKENLLIGGGNEEEMKAACASAMCEEFISEFPNGYITQY